METVMSKRPSHRTHGLRHFWNSPLESFPATGLFNSLSSNGFVEEDEYEEYLNLPIPKKATARQLGSEKSKAR